MALVPAQPLPAPVASSEWLAATRAEWNALWRSDAPVIRALMDSDLMGLRRLFDLYDEHERALRAYRRKRLVQGSQGQPVMNPAGRLVRELASEIRQLEDRYGLSPAARLRLGHQGASAALTLAQLNQALEDDEHAHEDPRLEVIDASA